MKYSVHCQNPPCVRFVVECEANSPDDAKKIVRENIHHLKYFMLLWMLI